MTAASHAKLEALEVFPPAHPLVGRVTPPGSKSITNRALLLAALAKGTSRLTGALKSRDTQLMARALGQMGVTVEEPDATSFVVTSDGTLKAPAGQHLLAKKRMAEFEVAGDPGSAQAAARSLIGHLDHIAQIDDRFRSRAAGNRSRLRKVLVPEV